MQPALKSGGQHKQHQGEHAQQHVFIVLVEELGDQHPHHRQPQHKVDGVHQLFVLDMTPFVALWPFFTLL